jgi:flagella basal body P-ring formation protein FlgA
MGTHFPFAAVVVGAALAFGAPAYAQDAAARLRGQIVVSGPAVTLGDLFENAGDVAGRAVAPSPAAGQTARFSARFVSAAAAAAGLAWVPPDGVEDIEVTRNGGRGAGAARVPGNDAPVMIRRGETITLVYVAPGLQLTTRGRALNDAAVGEPVRVVNLQSNMTVEAMATGPGSASASPSR